MMTVKVLIVEAENINSGQHSALFRNERGEKGGNLRFMRSSSDITDVVTNVNVCTECSDSEHPEQQPAGLPGPLQAFSWSPAACN